MDLDFSSDNPKTMTYHSSKGLQFEHVFIPECTVEDDANRNPLYVAVTRTYRALYIMHSGNLSSLFDDVPTSLYDTSPYEWSQINTIEVCQLLKTRIIMKLYIPTCTLNFNNILSSESISPLGFYARRGLVTNASILSARTTKSK